MQEFTIRRLHLLSCALLLLLGAGTSASERSERSSDFFEQRIRPVLAETCFRCHGAKKQKGQLRLDSLDALLAGGKRGAAVVPGKPDASLLLRALRHDDLEMPPKKRLADETIADFEAWIAAGAHWPETSSELRSEAATIPQADRDWWAFRPIRQSAPPNVEAEEWAKHPIDRFVLDRMRKSELRPAPRADRATLIRRAYFQLVGVPPTPEETRAFVADERSDAWELLIDRLLADPRYGERQASFWLDLVRYSDSDGWNQDAFRPHIWRYRDYVIESFNADKPYREFVREQIAGDEVPGDDPRTLTAVGFLRLGIYEYNQRDARGLWNDIVSEMTDVVGDAFLGLSMGCARCHDHKFDPIPQTDYYRLRAFFDPVVWRDDLPGATLVEQQAYEEKLAQWKDATKDIRARLDRVLDPYRRRKWKSTVAKFPLDIQACFHKPESERTSWEHQMAYLVSRQFLEEGGGPFKSLSKKDKAQREALEKELAAFDQIKPRPLPALMTASDWPGTVTPTVLPDRADQQAISPGYLAVLSGEGSQDASPASGIKQGTAGRRSDLARWIARDDNPLTMRVIVNRIWQQHFGRGIVATPSNFGRTGDRPTHPELLDWLVTEFVAGAQRWKRLHKLILTSETWRQSSSHPHAREFETKDPGDSLYWRASVRRLSAEQIRDAMLLLSGELGAKVGGPSVDEKQPRRGLYVKRYRNRTETFLHVFDAAAGLKSVDARGTTTTPTQALLLANGDYALARARAFAKRLASEKRTKQERIDGAMTFAWGRRPSEDELASAERFVTSKDGTTIDAERWVDFCHLLLNSNAFLYVD